MPICKVDYFKEYVDILSEENVSWKTIENLGTQPKFQSLYGFKPCFFHD